MVARLQRASDTAMAVRTIESYGQGILTFGRDTLVARFMSSAVSRKKESEAQ